MSTHFRQVCRNQSSGLEKPSKAPSPSHNALGGRGRAKKGRTDEPLSFFCHGNGTSMYRVDRSTLCENQQLHPGRERSGGTYREVVSEAGAGLDWTLRDKGRPIHVGSAVHEQAMEMEGGGLISQRIQHVDDDPVADVCFDPREGPLAVDSDRWPIPQAIGIRMTQPMFQSYVTVAALATEMKLRMRVRTEVTEFHDDAAIFARPVERQRW